MEGNEQDNVVSAMIELENKTKGLKKEELDFYIQMINKQLQENKLTQEDLKSLFENLEEREREHIT